MPMTILPKSLYLHIPRTGGNWVTRAVCRAVKGVQEDQELRRAYNYFYGHGGIDRATADGFVGDRFAFTFVRHPLDWIMSYWRRRMITNWHPAGNHGNPWEIFEECYSNDFNKFADKIIADTRCHGAVTRIYRALTEIKGECKVDFIGKQEDLVDDLIKALELAGEKFDEKVIRNFDLVNISNYEKFPAEYTPEQETRLLEIEQEAIQMFGY